MIVRARGQPAGLRRAALPADDSGVSPVIGMIMVLGISIVGIAGILYWGLPAIDEMKANVEYRSVQTQFGELDSTIRELVAGTTEKTAKRWQPSINRGSISVHDETEPWLYAMETYHATNQYDFIYLGFADGDHAFQIKNNGPNLVNAYVEAYVVSGTTSLTALTVNDGAGTTQMTPGGWNAGDTKTLKLWTKDATPVAQNLQDAVFKIRIFSDASNLRAEAWYGTTSRIDYDLHTVSSKSITYNNGAIISTAAGSSAITNTPSIPPIADTAGTPRFFGRLVQLTGSAGFAGDNRFDLLISLYSTATLASYDCQLATYADCVQSSKLYVWGTQKDIWNSYLTREGLGYGMTQKSDGAGGVYLEQREAKMAYTLLASTVRLVG